MKTCFHFQSLHKNSEGETYDQQNPIATANYMVTVTRRAFAFTLACGLWQTGDASNITVPNNNTFSQQQQYQPNSPSHISNANSNTQYQSSEY